MEQENKSHSYFYILKGGFVETLVSNVIDYSMIIIMLLFNYKILDGSWIITTFFLIIWLLAAYSRNSKYFKKFESIEELKEYLNKNDK